eukprot:TRINITY_DN5730_c0_g5_i2.p3 TRINITY_DN5730_c0_g5~~TRINITY_DN5730_c0_g5_i2.p3  ORF type:complete len:198 (+),score=-1.95 TRINITY_DN5730_c0_g5_i2:1258-1851(+)
MNQYTNKLNSITTFMMLSKKVVFSQVQCFYVVYSIYGCPIYYYYYNNYQLRIKKLLHLSGWEERKKIKREQSCMEFICFQFCIAVQNHFDYIFYACKAEKRNGCSDNNDGFCLNLVLCALLYLSFKGFRKGQKNTRKIESISNASSVLPLSSTYIQSCYLQFLKSTVLQCLKFRSKNHIQMATVVKREKCVVVNKDE